MSKYLSRVIYIIFPEIKKENGNENLKNCERRTDVPLVFVCGHTSF